MTTPTPCSICRRPTTAASGRCDRHRWAHGRRMTWKQAASFKASGAHLADRFARQQFAEAHPDEVAAALSIQGMLRALCTFETRRARRRWAAEGSR